MSTLDRLLQKAKDHLDDSRGHYHDLVEGCPDEHPGNEAYYAAVVAFAVTILSRAPTNAARGRVQLLAHEIAKLHDVDLGDEKLHAIRLNLIEDLKAEDPEYAEKLSRLGVTFDAVLDGQ